MGVIVPTESPDLLVKEIIKLLVSEKLCKKFVTNMCRIIKKMIGITSQQKLRNFMEE